LYKFPMHKLKKISMIICLLCIINLISIILYSIFLADKPKEVRLLEPKNILIFGAHQDDCVIQAGGVAIQNSKLGGTTNIVYLTIPSNPTYATIRKKEAKDAWDLLNDPKIRLSFLDFESSREWPKQKRDAAEGKIAEIIGQINPEVVYIPLNEGGSLEHDILNSMVLDVIKRFPSVKVIQSAEYNPYLIMKNTPTKVLWFLVRLMPFVSYKEPNYGLDPTKQTKLSMTRDEFNTKIDMLLRFESQKDTIPLSQFGYEDLFDSSNKKPEYFVHIGGKFLSPWAVLTIALVLLTFFIWGSYHSVCCFNKSVIFAFLIVGWSGIIILGFTNSRLLIEDFLYPISYLGGVSIASLIQPASELIRHDLLTGNRTMK